MLRLVFGVFVAFTLVVGETKFQDDWTRYENSNTHAIKAYSSLNSQKRSERATNTHSCDTIRTQVPSHLTFITRWNFYRKYTEAYGIPIVSSSRVSDKALKRACHVTRFLFADRYDLRNAFLQNQGRFAVIAIAEQTTTIPEFSHLPNWWNQRARGLGGVLGRAVSCGGEENVLCLRQDRYYGDDIFFHEAAHGVASYFNNHIEGPNPPNGVHGHVNTRAELKSYDPGLYNLIKELYPCGNSYQWCKDSAAGPNFRTNCDGTGPVVTQKPATIAPFKTTTEDPIPPIPETPLPPTNCTDKNTYCGAWARYGYCTSNNYVKLNCKVACGTC